jgi:predicted ATPase/predicted negative regulator of RcsB-dependent stress response
VTRARSKTPLLPLIGRQRELSALHAELKKPGVTVLVGPPGAGKSHLVRAYVDTSWARERGLASFWVELTHCSDADVLCSAIAAELALPSEPGHGDRGSEAAVARVARGLASHGEALLVLEHFDALVDAGAPLLRRLAELAPSARIVVTSRARLPIACAELSVGPLALPASDAADDVQGSAAVQMLLHRASRYRFRPEDAATLAELARALDGLPLALELAARRLAVLSPRALLERLAERLDLLSKKDSASKVVTTLRTVIDRSWRDLAPPERSLLAQCAVFRGSFDVAALESVVDLRDGDDLLLDLLGSLLDRSLVQELDTPHGERRFSLLESIRQFALEQVEDLDALRLRHALYFGEGRLDDEDLDNLLGAYDFASSLPVEHGLALRVKLLLALLPLSKGLLSADECLERLDATLALMQARGDVDAEHEASLLLARGVARQQSGRVEQAQADLERGLSLLAESRGETRARLLCQLGMLQQAQGALDDASESLSRASELLPALRRPELEGRVHFASGLLRHSQGRLDAARTHYEHAADRFRVAAARDAEAETLAYLAALLLQRGHLQEARARYHDALALRDREGDRKLAAMIHGNLAILEQEEGELARAAGHFERGLLAAQQAGDRLLEGHLLGYRGCLAHEMGELALAQRHYEHALAVLREVRDPRLEGIFLGCLGAIFAVRDLEQSAHEAFQKAEAELGELADEGALGALSVHRAQLLVARARRAGEPEEVRVSCLESAQAVCDQARRDALFGASDDLRFSVRLLERALDADALVVELDDGGVAALGKKGSGTQDLSTRLPLRRIVTALVEMHRTRPGVAVSDDALIEAGWPGERIAHEASINRLKVALATLRKLGLRELMLRRDGGYLLDPAVKVRALRGGRP